MRLNLEILIHIRGNKQNLGGSLACFSETIATCAPLQIMAPYLKNTAIPQWPCILQGLHCWMTWCWHPYNISLEFSSNIIFTSTWPAEFTRKCTCLYVGIHTGIYVCTYLDMDLFDSS